MKTINKYFKEDTIMEKKVTKATLKRTFKRFYCSECGKALIKYC